MAYRAPSRPRGGDSSQFEGYGGRGGKPLGNAQTGYAASHLGAQSTDPENNIPLSEDAFTPTGIWNNMFRNRSTGNNPLSSEARAASPMQGPSVNGNTINDSLTSPLTPAPTSLSTMAAGGPNHIQMWGGQPSGGGAMRFPDMANDPAQLKTGQLQTGNLGNYASNVLSFNKSLYAPADTQQSTLPVTRSTANETWQAPTRSDAANIASAYAPDATRAIASSRTLPASSFMWGSNNTA